MRRRMDSAQSLWSGRERAPKHQKSPHFPQSEIPMAEEGQSPPIQTPLDQYSLQ